MRKTSVIILFFLAVINAGLLSQSISDTTIYLLTCSPGTSSYTIYGHSAMRVVIQNNKTDYVYNWGVFDPGTPNFIWKFAIGKLSYSLGVSDYNGFIQEYLSKKRSVSSNEINLDASEKRILLNLVQINYLPENRYYKYDFFYDNCSTRIRDLLEKTLGNKLIYPPEETGRTLSFREMTGEYQKYYPWLNLGANLIMGFRGDVKPSLRERMFLPLELQKNLTKTTINRSGSQVPILRSV